MIEQISVHSSFIKTAKYNTEKEILRLEMGSYFYFFHNVTKQKVARFKKAKSKGTYFCNYIKGLYEVTRRRVSTI